MDSLFKRAQSKYVFICTEFSMSKSTPPSMSRGTAFSVQENYRYSFPIAKEAMVIIGFLFQL